MIKPNFYTLPQAMYDLDVIEILLAHENNAILYKKLERSMLDMEKVIVSHSIVYVISGTVEVQTYEYEKFTVRDGEMLFMPRDSYLISDYIRDDEEMEVYLFFFDHSVSSEFLKHTSKKVDKAQNGILKLELSENLNNYMTSLQHISYKETGNQHLLRVKLFELLHLVCEANEKFLHTLQAQEEVKVDLESYMLEHYDKDLSVSDWATLSGYSLSTFNRKFKKRYNTSPKQWLLEHNMKLADEALRSGLSVSACAAEFGYSNTSNFIKAFSKIHKSTPKQYTMR